MPGGAQCILHNQYPAPVRIGQVVYPTLASGAPARAGWDDSLQATIAQLLRAKFQQHEALAEEFRATGDGRILFLAGGFGDRYAYNSRCLIIGRLLELVRAELRGQRFGLSDLGGLE